jgi:hypothetical protein
MPLFSYLTVRKGRLGNIGRKLHYANRPELLRIGHTEPVCSRATYSCREQLMAKCHLVSACNRPEPLQTNPCTVGSMTNTVGGT